MWHLSHGVGNSRSGSYFSPAHTVCYDTLPAANIVVSTDSIGVVSPEGVAHFALR